MGSWGQPAMGPGGLPFSCLLLISSSLGVQIETARSPRVIVEEANEWDFDSASALNRFDHHGYSRSNLMEQFLKERQKQEQQVEDFDYDLKFLPYSTQAGTASEGQSEHLVDL